MDDFGEETCMPSLTSVLPTAKHGTYSLDDLLAKTTMLEDEYSCTWKVDHLEERISLYSCALELFAPAVGVSALRKWQTHEECRTKECLVGTSTTLFVLGMLSTLCMLS